MGYDQDRKRPLEINVLSVQEDGGVSETEAMARGARVADAFLLIRLLVDESKVSLAYAAIEGWTGGPMSYDGLFNLWLALAGHLASQKTDREDHERIRVFVERVLNMTRLNAAMARLEADQAVEARAAAAAVPETPKA